jgi:hypothetical protein
MPTDIAKYSIELFRPGGEGVGIEEILDRQAIKELGRARNGSLRRLPQ